MAQLDGKQIKPGTITEDRLAPGVGGGAPYTGNKFMAAEVTAADGAEACATAIGHTPFYQSYVQVQINGASQNLGDGVKTADCYFSADAGATAKTIATIVQGDKLYWNGSISGYQLAITDKISFLFDI